MAIDLAPSQRMTDEEILSQIPLFVSLPLSFALSLAATEADLQNQLLAGNVTTSSTLAWAFVELAKDHHIQDRLRDELAGLEDEPSS